MRLLRPLPFPGMGVGVGSGAPGQSLPSLRSSTPILRVCEVGMPALCQVEKTGKSSVVVRRNHPHSDFWNLSVAHPCCRRRGCWPPGSAPSDTPAEQRCGRQGASRLGPLGFGTEVWLRRESVTSPGSGNSLPEVPAVVFWPGSPCPVSCCLTLLPPRPPADTWERGVLGLMPREVSRCTVCILGRWEGADGSAQWSRGGKSLRYREGLQGNREAG